MKIYLWTTGMIFALLAVAHVWRMIVEGNVVANPLFMAMTLLAAGLSLWAFCLLGRRGK